MSSSPNTRLVRSGTFPAPIRTRKRFSALLAATAIGVYLLLILGATTSLTDAASTCSTWPICTTPSDPLSQTELAIAWAHRIAAVVVGALVVAVTMAALLGTASKRVGYSLLVAVALYVVQVGVGAITATIGPAAIVPGLHLTLGIVVFAIVVIALAWDLESATEHTSATDHTHDAVGRTSSVGPLADANAKANATVDASGSEPARSQSTTSGVNGVEDNQHSIANTTHFRRRPPSETDHESGNRDTSDTVDTIDQTVTNPAADGQIARVRVTASAYVSMMKPRLMWLLCLVAAAGMALAAGRALDATTVVATLAGGVLAIGASGTFNHVLERDVDRQMSRTSDRPLAIDLIPVRNALLFGFVLTGASITVFLTINALAAALGLAAILFYSVVYTLLLKPNTVQNTVIGGLAGALPALIGWAAVTNEIGMPALALAGVIFLWTPAHFYNLALAYRDDYARGGFPMLPVVHGEIVTRKHILYYIGATLVGTLALAWITDLGWLYVAAVAAFGGLFLWMAVRLHFEQTEAAAFRSFHASNAFLGAVLVAVVVDALVF